MGEAKGQNKKVTTSSIVRQQAEFRSALLCIDGGKCAITGESMPEVLEAAHIIPKEKWFYPDPADSQLSAVW